VVDSSVLLGAVRSARTEVDLVSVDADDSAVMLAFPGLVHRFADGEVACLMVAVTGPRSVDPAIHKTWDLSQTWGWDRAAAVLAETTHSVVVTELFGRVHPPADRLRVFRLVMEVVIEYTAPVATWWPASGTALPPVLALERPVAGLVNVRMFQDANQPGCMVMDTLGMHSFGLLDVQCYFRDLDVTKMAGLLYAAAGYMIDGTVIESGHTVQGLTPSDRWRVNQTGSLVEPFRTVLDLDPGPPYRAVMVDAQD
jgi:hypothetical protein